MNPPVLKGVLVLYCLDFNSVTHRWTSELYMIVFSHLCHPSTIYILILMNLGKGHLCDVVLANMSALLFCVLGTGSCRKPVMLICTVTPALR